MPAQYLTGTTTAIPADWWNQHQYTLASAAHYSKTLTLQGTIGYAIQQERGFIQRHKVAISHRDIAIASSGSLAHCVHEARYKALQHFTANGHIRCLAIQTPLTDTTSTIRQEITLDNVKISDISHDIAMAYLNIEFILVMDEQSLVRWMEEWWSYKIASDVARAKETLKKAMRSNLHVFTAKNEERQLLTQKVAPNELKARETLRDMLIESEWRRYVTNGFIMARGNSGKWYQVFAAQNERVRVYENGKYITNLCIHSDGECPPTDHVINIKILVELDEDAVWRGANKHVISIKKRPQIFVPVKNLLDTFKDYRTIAS